MEFQKEFENSLRQLIQMLRALLSNQTQTPPDKFFQQTPGSKDQPIQVNICFLNVFPEMTEEELDDLENEWQAEAAEQPDLDKDWNKLSSSDIEFLKKHGLRF